MSGIEDKVLSMYARGMSQRDIAETIEEIYGFEVSSEKISKITDRVLDRVEEWQNRPLKKFYTFLFVDCMYVTIRREYETKSCAVYVILGYDVDGVKDILGLWISESEGKHQWMQIFDEIKARGVEDVLFISMDGVSGLEEGAKSIFPHVTVQRCIVHLIRNSIKYVPSKDYKAFTAQLKKVYGAPSLKAAEAEFERFNRFPPILVELKYNQTAQTAIDQINDREYQKFFESYSHVILVGISYKKNTKTKKHECIIKKHIFQ